MRRRGQQAEPPHAAEPSIQNRLVFWKPLRPLASVFCSRRSDGAQAMRRACAYDSVSYLKDSWIFVR
jgi:hypothetical protein